MRNLATNGDRHSTGRQEVKDCGVDNNVDCRTSQLLAPWCWRDPDDGSATKPCGCRVVVTVETLVWRLVTEVSRWAARTQALSWESSSLTLLHPPPPRHSDGRNDLGENWTLFCGDSCPFISHHVFSDESYHFTFLLTPSGISCFKQSFSVADREKVSQRQVYFIRRNDGFQQTVELLVVYYLLVLHVKWYSNKLL